MNQVVQISFAVPAKIYDNVAKRAGPLNIKPAEYARRLFEAAWTARVAGERGLETEDRALDHQVRQVFLLADCEPEYIADALQLPLDRVKKILGGWRQAARDLIEPPAAAPAAEPAEELKSGPLSAEEIAVLRNMWREGKPIADIAETLGRKTDSIKSWAKTHRDVCPQRKFAA